MRDYVGNTQNKSISAYIINRMKSAVILTALLSFLRG